MTAARHQVVGSYRLSVSRWGKLVGLLYGCMSGTLLVVYQICAAGHDIFLFLKGDTCILPD
jgi:hypothetical protein